MASRNSDANATLSPVGSLHVTINESRSYVTQTSTSVIDMTSIAAEAVKAQAQSQSEIARSTHEVPAKEETKRALVVGGCVVVGILAISLTGSSDLAWPIATLCGVLGAVQQIGAAVKQVNKKS